MRELILFGVLTTLVTLTCAVADAATWANGIHSPLPTPAPTKVVHQDQHDHRGNTGAQVLLDSSSTGTTVQNQKSTKLQLVNGDTTSTVTIPRAVLWRKPYAHGVRRRGLLSLFFGGELDTPLPNPQYPQPPPASLSPYGYQNSYSYPYPYYAMQMPTSPTGLNMEGGSSGIGEDGLYASMGTDLALTSGVPGATGVYDSNYMAQLPPYWQGQGQGPDAVSQFYPGAAGGLGPSPWSPYPYSYPGMGVGSVNPAFSYTSGIQFNPDVFHAILDFANTLLTHYSSTYSAPPPGSEGEVMYDEDYAYGGYDQDPALELDFQDGDGSLYAGDGGETDNSYYSSNDSNELYKALLL